MALSRVSSEDQLGHDRPLTRRSCAVAKHCSWQGRHDVGKVHPNFQDCAEGILASAAIEQSAGLIEHLRGVNDLALLV